MGTIVAMVMAAMTALATELAMATFLAVGLLLCVITLTVVATTMLTAAAKDHHDAHAAGVAKQNDRPDGMFCPA